VANGLSTYVKMLSGVK